MSSIFRRGRKLHAKIRDVNGIWRQVATGYSVGDEDKALRWVADREREIASAKPGDRPLTVAEYARQWLDRRRTDSIGDDRTRINRHALPRLGHLMMVDVRPRHLRDLIMSLREAGTLAPTTIRQVSGLLHTMFKSAVIEERIPSNPVLYERGVLPEKADKDPTWRHEAIYTRGELETLLTDARVPLDRRVLYALKGIAALRHGEAARLTWAIYDDAAKPLGSINLGRTKSGRPRRIPVHPELAKLLETWRTTGWESTYGRAPELDDLVVPTRAGLVRAASASQQALLDDLARIGLRTHAGEHRYRRGHDLRRTLITLARTDGAIDALLRWVTHGPRSTEMLDQYSSPPWAALCAEIAKLQIDLGTVVVQPSQAVVTVKKSERPQRDSNAREPTRSDARRKGVRGVAGSAVAPGDADVQGTAPSLGAVDLGLRLPRKLR